MPEKIWDIINKKLEIYDKIQIDANPHFAPRQKDILDLIDFYWVNKYRIMLLTARVLKKHF